MSHVCSIKPKFGITLLFQWYLYSLSNSTRFAAHEQLTACAREATQGLLCLGFKVPVDLAAGQRRRAKQQVKQETEGISFFRQNLVICCQRRGLVVKIRKSTKQRAAGGHCR